MVPVYLILFSIIHIISVTNGNTDNIVDTDSRSYLSIDSHLNPTFNTSYGTLQILDEISIEFNLIYHGNRYNNTSDNYQNIFSIASSSTSSNAISTNDNIHCTQYPSVWLLPNDNSLYFSLYNTPKYCLMPSVNPIEPDIPYIITIQYNISNIFISINDSIIINDFLYPNNERQNEMDRINIFISNSQSNPACVELYNIYIETRPMYNNIISENSNRINMDSNSANNNKHENTIFIIEIAVLTIFCFACLGVIIASLCLLKMRQNSSKMLSSHRKNASKMIRQRPSSNKLFNKLSNKFNKFQSESKIYSPTEKHKKAIETFNSFDISKIVSNSSADDDDDDDIKYNNDNHNTIDNNSNAESTIYNNNNNNKSIQRSKSEYILNKHILNKNKNKNQIPKYESSNGISSPTNPSTNQSMKKILSSNENQISSPPNTNSGYNDFKSSNEGNENEQKINQIKSISNTRTHKRPISVPMDGLNFNATIQLSGKKKNSKENSLTSDITSSSIEDMFNPKHTIESEKNTLGALIEDDSTNINMNIVNNSNDKVSSIPPEIPPTFFNNIDDKEVSTIPPTIPPTFFNNIDETNDISTIPPTIPPTFFNNIDTSTVPPTFYNNGDNNSTVPPTFFMEDPSTIAPPFPLSGVSLGPSIPSLATEITNDIDNCTVNFPDDNDNNNDINTETNNYSTLTNITYLTSATNRYKLHSDIDTNYNFSSSEDLNQLSSGDESTCITIPKHFKRNHTNTISLSQLSMVKTINNNISKHYSNDYSSTNPNIQISNSMTNNNNNNNETSASESTTDLNIPHSLNSITKFTTDKTISYFDAKTKLTLTNVDSENEQTYEWIKSALISCDEIGWNKYFQNFRKHKVNEKRLNKLDEYDWRELIPDIGPRNDFKELWKIRQINVDLN